MGSIIISTMAGSTLVAEHKKLHPFFTAPKSLQPDAPSTIATPSAPTPALDEAQPITNRMDEPEADIPKRKKRKSMEEADEDLEDAKKPKRGRPRKVVVPGPSIMKHFPKKDDEDKGPAASSLSSAAAHEDIEGAGAAPSGNQVQAKVPNVEDENINTKAMPPVQNHHGDEKNTPPKKMLQFNPRTGTIGSPPISKESQSTKKQTKAEDTTENTTILPNKGKRRSKRIATITYGLDDASRIRIGAQIDSILEDTTKPRPGRKVRTRTTPRVQRKVQYALKMDADYSLEDSEAEQRSSKKSTHPFFTGKAKETAALAAKPAPAPTIDAVRMKPPPAPTGPRIFSSTPCSPRKPRPAAPSAAPFPQFGVKSMGLKTPGAQHPAWPPKGMVHIRGDDVTPKVPQSTREQLSGRKSKGRTIHIPTMENVLHNFAAQLHISEAVDAAKNTNTDSFLPPPKELRLPQKHFESGAKLEGRVLREVKNPGHPALAQLRDSLVTSLSAFDRCTCESVSWTQKYSPTSASEVLQHGKEAFLLRTWLEAMKVLSVDTGDVKVKPAKPPKKKRKKAKDDFVVDSDEEADDMDEVSDLEEDWSPDRRGVKKTVIRAGDNAARDYKNPGRLTNTVVISGPHGCGKTSAVYAIAKELEFEVFEINSGSRRSGKDILEKIGDMTRNHLVQHQQTEAQAAAIDEEEVAQDIKSGKQATMNSFFQPKANTQPVKPKPAKEAPVAVKTELKKTSPKNQKQSLILLDEVDILYDEDKQFWSTVITLIAQSKRPFIMTCNDESLVPLQTLSLHGIFRFSTPPTDLAVDRLLMITACEGHALRRNAVQALYDARQQDLRACLMDLNCWCQVAVGDNRGGVDWMLPRWPKGCDLDADGNVVRVISQDTLVEGMGWLGHDVVCHETEQCQREEELAHEVNDFWQMDLTNWHDSLDLASWAGALDMGARERLSALKGYEKFTDALSCADLSSAMTSTFSFEGMIDCTHPEITERTRDDYTLGRQLLDAPLKLTFDPLATSMPITLKCLARRTLQASIPGGAASALNTFNELDVIHKIRQRAIASTNVADLSRDDFSIAFDALAISEKEASSASSYLDPSIFDGIMRNIVVDVAPYVRNIVTFEKELQRQRQKLSSLLSQGGIKRARKTRAANAALEGSSRSTVRRDKWFKADLNGVLVMRTAGEGWVDAVQEPPMSTIASSNSAAGSAEKKPRARRIVTDGCSDENGSVSEVEVD